MSDLKEATRGIYKRGSVYWLAVQKDRKRTFVSLETGDLLQAIRTAGEIRNSSDLPSGIILIHAVKRYVKFQMDHGHWTRNTETSKAPALNVFAKFCGNVTAADVTSDKIKEFYRDRMKAAPKLDKKAVSKSTAYGNVMTISGFFRWCIEEEKTVKENPCDKLNLIFPGQAARKDFCTPEERDRLIRECPREDLKFILYCGFHAGLRRQEIGEARPFWFDLKAGLLHLRKTPTIQFKDFTERTIPLTSEFQEFLKIYGLRDPFMLHPEVPHGKWRYRYDFRRPFTDYMAAQGMDWVTPHIMRHTFASLLASAGVSLYKIANWLGDGPRVTEKTYAKFLPNDPDIERGISSHPRLPSPSTHPDMPSQSDQARGQGQRGPTG